MYCGHLWGTPVAPLRPWGLGNPRGDDLFGELFLFSLWIFFWISLWRGFPFIFFTFSSFFIEFPCFSIGFPAFSSHFHCFSFGSLVFHWFSFMCFTIFIIFIFLFFFPGCIGFFRCEPSFFAWHVLGLEPSARQFNRNTDVLDDDDNDDDGDNDFSMVFIDFSMVFISFSLAPIYVFIAFIFLLVSSIFHGCFHCFSMVGTGFSMVFIVPIRQSTHLHLQNFLTCASYSLAPPTLTCASDLAHLRLHNVMIEL